MLRIGNGRVFNNLNGDGLMNLQLHRLRLSALVVPTKRTGLKMHFRVTAPHANTVAFLHPSVRHIRPLSSRLFFSSLPLQPPQPPAPVFPPRRYWLATAIRKRNSSSSSSAAVSTATKNSVNSNNSPSSSSSSSSTLVIVESPAKASTIQKILPPSDYIVRSCVGHIREIPSSAKRIPVKYKGYQWASLGVDVEQDFRPIYVLISGKQSIITDLKKELSKSSRLVLATDDDREGEAISWHLLQVLKPTVPVHRAVFHEITPNAIHEAFSNFRTLNMSLVDAQETRRVLDRLAGYTMSPLLWKKIARGLSAGRVQSVAMAEIVRRERLRLLFKSAKYTGANFVLSKDNSHFKATLSSINDIRLVRGNDFDDTTGNLQSSIHPSNVIIYNSTQMQSLCQMIKIQSNNIKNHAIVKSVDCKRTTRNPPPPLITSTLQQECGNRLGMGAGQTMSIAQKLYETGVITYMRTDNPVLSDEAISTARKLIEQLYGKESLWDGSGQSGRRSKKKPKAAQAAHEAIRPAGANFPHPDDVPNLNDIERSVYAIIYRRALASQMAPAKLDQTTVRLVTEVEDDNNDVNKNTKLELKATGSVVVNPGYLQLYQQETTIDDNNNNNNNETSSSSYLPSLKKGDIVNIHDVSVLNHETKPPPRFNDASLVKTLEELGVGRPSTYAGIIEKLITRGYVYRGRDLPTEKKVPPKALVPSLTAFAVESLLSTHFPSFVDAQFTARMEQALDEIAEGSANRVAYLRTYYCGENGLAESVSRQESNIDARKFREVILPNMPNEMLNQLEQQVGRGHNDNDGINESYTDKSISSSSNSSNSSSNHSDSSGSNGSGKSNKTTTATASTTRMKKSKKGYGGSDRAATGVIRKENGEIDWSCTKVLVNSYGPYIEQNGSVVTSLPKTTVADDLNASHLESTLDLAEDPVIGTDSNSGLDVLLKTSRFGPYVQLGRETDVRGEGEKPKRCGLGGMDVRDVTLEYALKLLSLPRLLGVHPTSGEEIRAALGPYGPYVVHGSTFVSLKKGVDDVLEIGLEEAMKLIDETEKRKQKRLEARQKQKIKNKNLQ